MNSSNYWEQSYLDIMQEILQVAEDTGVTPDRTGSGRVRVFGRDIRVDLSSGIIPIVTTRKINYEHGIEELLWMIKGSYNIGDLKENTKPIWKLWAIEEKDIDAFIAKFFKDGEPEALGHLKENLMKQHIGSIGPMYGAFWRNNPAFNETALLPFNNLLMEDIPSDKLKRYGEEYEEMVFFVKNEFLEEANSQSIKEEELKAFLDKRLIETSFPIKEQYIKKRYFESNDQLGEIIRGIKRRPYSARHCLSVWIPQFLPYEGTYSPHENILLGLGALAPCHVFTQFFVEKALDGGANYLSLRMTQRSCDLPLGVCTNLIFYATLLHLVAHCTDLRVKELIWSGGDVHIYANQIEGAMEQVYRSPLPSPTIKINPNVKDLFAIQRSDIEIIDYQHHPHIKYPVSV